MAEIKTLFFKWEIATLYGVSTRTMSRILKDHEPKIGKPMGYRYSALQVASLKSILGDYAKIEAN